MYIFEFFFILSTLSTIKCEFYSSIDKIKTVFDAEIDILENFQEIVAITGDFRDFIDEKLEPWINENEEAKNDVQKYVTNPLNAYLLLKRNVYDARMLIDDFHDFIEDLQEKIAKIEEKTFVEEKEVAGAVGGILRASKAYKLKAEDLVEGSIDDSKTRKPLTPHDIFILAKSVSNDKQNHFFMGKFLEIARQKIEAGEDSLNEVSYEDIDNLMETLAPEIPDPYDESYTLTAHRNNNAEVALVQKTCRGDLKQSKRETNNLRCRFVSYTPFSSIAPFKLEEFNLEPYIVMYHEVLSDKEIDHLNDIARRNQYRATTGKIENAEASDFSRLAQVMWMQKTEYPEEVRIFDARFEDMTGLNMDSSDPLQIQNYGVGGHYYAHYDTFDGGKYLDESKKHRIATLMIYMSNVEKGGATVFPFLKLRVEPQKGSAIFWYNLKHSGHHEPYTMHSGCPILLGSKWVANKWIYNDAQILRKPCLPGQFIKKDYEAEMFLNFKED